VRVVIELAQALGLDAVAEGVEQRQQADALERLGCKLAQGYLFSRPVPAGEMVKALARGPVAIR